MLLVNKISSPHIFSYEVSYEGMKTFILNLQFFRCFSFRLIDIFYKDWFNSYSNDRRRHNFNG